MSDTTFQVFLPSIGELRPDEQAPHVLVHDNAPIHTARLVREWLEANADQVSILTLLNFGNVSVFC